MKKNVWIMNHYAGEMFFQQGGRHYWFAKNLKAKGYNPIVFCSNAKHGSIGTFFDNDSLWQEHISEDNIPFVFVRARTYEGNGKQRILNMIDFYRNVQKAAKEYVKAHTYPDIIYASSVHPLTIVAGIHLAKHFNVGCIAEIRDLWPESIVEYSNRFSRDNLLIRLLYQGEKWIYTKADAIIFTMEGGKDYIIEKGWDKEHGGPVDLAKVHYINNGVDLEEFEYNAKNCIVEDLDLYNPELFTVVYTGAIRMANGLGLLVESAKLLSERKDIKILIWGSGEDEASLRQQVKEAQLENIEFKGRVDKKYVPSIVTRSSLNIHSLDPRTLPLLKYGGSFNKLFEYLAAGKPVMSTVKTMYSPLADGRCGIEANETTPECVANTIMYFADMSTKKREKMGKAAREIASDYDFKALTQKLIGVIEHV